MSGLTASRILYLHGFASCGESNKTGELKAYFGGKNFLSPDLPPAPVDAVEMIRELINTEKINMLIGSSLGGFYATYFAEINRMKAILINPSIRPFDTLASYVGWQQRYCDDELFEFKSAYLEHFKLFQCDSVGKGDYLVLLQSEDEVLDYRDAMKYYKSQRIVVEYGGNHRFENISDYLCMIQGHREK
ncbi:MAG: YqiA/YcfP family alpha/beta fold hydrolase [Campylobacterota bacterium]|nr:YqiA/YcfP family alpha/beta fold hydrolase [Campylobacterota bacterium]